VASSIAEEELPTNDASFCVKATLPSSILVNSPSSVTPALRTESACDKLVATTDEAKCKNHRNSISSTSVNLLAKFLENRNKSTQI